MPSKPQPHPSGARPPQIPRDLLPRHVAIVMDGNGRWAKDRGLPRTAGHEAGEGALLDVVSGAIEVGLRWVTVYAFSTENWKRPVEEVRFLMGFNRDVVHRRREHGIGAFRGDEGEIGLVPLGDFRGAFQRDGFYPGDTPAMDRLCLRNDTRNPREGRGYGQKDSRGRGDEFERHGEDP